MIGLEEFNLRILQRVPNAEEYNFHKLLDYQVVVKDPNSRVNDLLDQATQTLQNFDGSIDAIVGYWDFPTILMMPILRQKFELPGPSLESVLRCEHKYWSRLIQREVCPDNVPDFSLVNPFQQDIEKKPPLSFPFWIKPVKAHSSQLGFRVKDKSQYRQAISRTRDGIEIFAENLNQIMERADSLPEQIRGADGWHCIAEQIISAGRQCTLEGYVHQGEVVVYGVVDSIRGRNRSSFERYQYPSTVPESVQQEMIDKATRVIEKTGLDASPFNIEFFWEKKSGQIWLLEINARISKSHSPLFEKVHGSPHNEVMLDVALGRKPDYPREKGQFKYAAKFMHRRYHCQDDQKVQQAPSDEKVESIEKEFDESDIKVHVDEGMRLGDLHEQDSYSHELAEIFVGADSQKSLLRKYNSIVDRLGIEIEGCPREGDSD